MRAHDPIACKLEAAREHAGVLDAPMLRTCGAEARALREEVERLLALPADELDLILRKMVQDPASA